MNRYFTTKDTKDTKKIMEMIQHTRRELKVNYEL